MDTVSVVCPKRCQCIDTPPQFSLVGVGGGHFSSIFLCENYKGLIWREQPLPCGLSTWESCGHAQAQRGRVAGKEQAAETRKNLPS